jgi:biopolymer transport protein ExbD
MKTKLFLLAVLIGAGSVISAAPARREEPPRKADKRPAPAKPAPKKNDKRPAPAKPAPRKAAPPAPVVVRPAPVVVRPAPVALKAPVVYQPRRNTYTIQLNMYNGILFEQRIVGMEELKAKIRMVSNDRPRPFIVVRVADGVKDERLQHALRLLKQAGFHDVKVERLSPRARMVPGPRKPAPRMKRPVR